MGKERRVYQAYTACTMKGKDSHEKNDLALVINIFSGGAALTGTIAFFFRNNASPGHYIFK